MKKEIIQTRKRKPKAMSSSPSSSMSSPLQMHSLSHLQQNLHQQQQQQLHHHSLAYSTLAASTATSVTPTFPVVSTPMSSSSPQAGLMMHHLYDHRHREVQTSEQRQERQDSFTVCNSFPQDDVNQKSASSSSVGDVMASSNNVVDNFVPTTTTASMTASGIQIGPHINNHNN
jgi:hypothetical protein